jgi:8-oxo-dGTP pyrophosphatase MutT (NUDIX family)
VPLTLDFLKSRLSLVDRCLVAPAGLVPAGVLAPVFEAAGELRMLFTQRTMHLKDHQGQISFPGGVRDEGDHDLLATALRETEEEIGLPAAVVEILGDLTPVSTTTGYWIHPFVALIPHPYDFRLNHHEVRRLLTFPVADFSRPERWSAGPYTCRGRTFQVFCWKYQETVIWGATARMMLDFLHRLEVHPVPLNLLREADRSM